MNSGNVILISRLKTLRGDNCVYKKFIHYFAQKHYILHGQSWVSKWYKMYISLSLRGYIGAAHSVVFVKVRVFVGGK